MSAFFQYPAHFLQSLVQVLEVPDTEGCGYCVEALVLEREVEAVFLGKGDGVFQSQLLYLLSAYLHHAFRDVCSD